MTAPRAFSHETALGRGRSVLDRAGSALLNWEMHQRAGVVVVTDGPAAPGRLLTLLPRTGPAAWLRLSAPCAVTETIHTPHVRGFTYRTLPGHPERGWETFEVIREPVSDAVRLRITGESAHATLLARVGAPVARLEQRRLTRAYLAALKDIATR